MLGTAAVVAFVGAVASVADGIVAVADTAAHVVVVDIAVGSVGIVAVADTAFAVLVVVVVVVVVVVGSALIVVASDIAAVAVGFETVVRFLAPKMLRLVPCRAYQSSQTHPVTHKVHILPLKAYQD